MRNFSEMIEILNNFDKDDYDVVKELIPLVYSESTEEYNQSFHFFDDDKDDLKFIIADRIFWFLIDNAKDWDDEIDLNIILESVEDYF
jgi:hypothetical protein